MTDPANTDLRGLAQLATQATIGVTDLVEALHCAIARPIGGAPARANGITGIVYRSVRGVARWVGSGLDLALSRLPDPLSRIESLAERDAIVAALNGVIGDQLADSANPLATRMQLRRQGREIGATEFDAIGPRWLLLVHGLCLSERDWQGADYDHGGALANAFGYAPLALRYNTGLHISSNGRALAALLEQRIASCATAPDEIAVVAHSMGGLVVRSALSAGEAAGHAWVHRVKRIAFLGTPHRGAALERGGHWVDRALELSRYSAPFARLGKIRSAGITDLRHGNVLDEHWQGQDRFARGAGPQRPLPLPTGVQCFALAASLSKAPTAHPRGDGLVSIASALGRGSLQGLAIPADRQWIGYGMSHMALLRRPEVANQLIRFFGRADAPESSP